MENEIIPVIKATNDRRLNAGKQPDEKEKDDDGVKLPERDLVMKRPAAGQAPEPLEKQKDDFNSSDLV